MTDLKIVFINFFYGVSLFGFCLCNVVAIAQETLPVELEIEQAKKLAIANNSSLKISRSRIQENQGEVERLRGGRTPKIESKANWITFDNDRLQSFGSGFAPESSRWDAQVDARMTVYSSGRSSQAIKGQEALTEARQSDQSTVEQDMLLELQTYYIQALLAQKTIGVRRENIKVLEKQLLLSENKFNAGKGANFDVLQAKVALGSAHPPLTRAQNEFKKAIDSLRRIVGLKYPEGKEAKDVILSPFQMSWDNIPQVDEAIQLALKNRSDLETLRFQMEYAKHRVQVIKRKNRPDVDLFVSYGFESDQFDNGEILTGWTAGTEFRWLFSNFGEQKGEIQQAKAQLDQATVQLERVERIIESDIRRSYYDLEEASTIRESTTLLMSQAKEAFSLATNRYKAGIGTQLDVLESQLSLSQAQLENSEAQHDYYLAVLRIQRAVGEIS